jgi:hypothetical protein
VKASIGQEQDAPHAELARAKADRRTVRQRRWAATITAIMGVVGVMAGLVVALLAQGWGLLTPR